MTTYSSYLLLERHCLPSNWNKLFLNLKVYTIDTRALRSILFREKITSVDTFITDQMYICVYKWMLLIVYIVYQFEIIYVHES